MKNAFTRIDIFEYKPNLYFQGKSSSTSVLGSILSILVGISIVIIGVFFIRVSLDRKKYVLNSSDVIHKGTFDLKPLGFDFAFSLRDGWGKGEFEEFDKYLNVTNYHVGYGNTWGSFPKLVPCGLVDKGLNFSLVNFTYTCFEDTPKNNHTLNRYGGGPNTHGIYVNTCKNRTDESGNLIEPICYPQEKIVNRLLSREMYIYTSFRNFEIDHSSQDNVFKPYVHEQFLKVSLDIYVRYLMKFTPIIYQIDVGYVFEDIRNFTGFIYSGVEIQIDAVKNLKDKFTHFDIVLDPYKRIYLKSYVKLQEVAANIGGIAKFILLIAQGILYSFNQNVFIFDFFNSIYSTSSINKTESHHSIIESKFEANLNLQPSKVSKLQSITSNNKIYFAHLDSSQSMNKNNDVAVVKKDMISATFFELLGCPTKKLKIIQNEVFRITSLEKLFLNLIELVRIKDYILHEKNLIYTGDFIENNVYSQYSRNELIQPYERKDLDNNISLKNMENNNNSSYALTNTLKNNFTSQGDFHSSSTKTRQIMVFNKNKLKTIK